MKVCGVSQNPMFCTNLTAAPSSHPAYVNICLIFFFKSKINFYLKAKLSVTIIKPELDKLVNFPPIINIQLHMVMKENCSPEAFPGPQSPGNTPSRETPC